MEGGCRNGCGVILMGTLLIIVAILALVCGVRILVNSSETYDPRHPDLAQYASELGRWQEGLKQLPTVPNDSMSRDSVINLMRNNQILMLTREDELIADFRQEMNNNINKVNTWLAYALGVMALFGVILPLFIQYYQREQDNRLYNALKQETTKVNNDARVLQKEVRDKFDERSREFEELSREIKEFVTEEVNDARTMQKEVRDKFDERSREFKELGREIKESVTMEVNDARTMQKEVRDKFDERSKEFKELGRKIKESVTEDVKLMELITNFMSFSVGIEDRMLMAQPDRDNLLRYMWGCLTDSIWQVVKVNMEIIIQLSQCKDSYRKNENEVYEKKDVPPEKIKKRMIICLIILNSTIARLRNGITVKRNRELDNISDRIRSAIFRVDNWNGNPQSFLPILENVNVILENLDQIKIP